MMSDCVLDISNIFHSTTVDQEGVSCCGRTEATTVLRDVSARVHGGEVLAVLGSKGSGKRALLDVIGNYIFKKWKVYHFRPSAEKRHRLRKSYF